MWGNGDAVFSPRGGTADESPAACRLCHATARRSASMIIRKLSSSAFIRCRKPDNNGHADARRSPLSNTGLVPREFLFGQTPVRHRWKQKKRNKRRGSRMLAARVLISTRTCALGPDTRRYRKQGTRVNSCRDRDARCRPVRPLARVLLSEVTTRAVDRGALCANSYRDQRDGR